MPTSSFPSGSHRAASSRVCRSSEKMLAPYAFLQIDEPKLYDFARYNECLMTR